MPTVSGNYVAPTWSNDAPPAINASELQAMSDAIQRSDQNKEYVFTFGDRIDSGQEVVTHPTGYVYLDTGDAMSFLFDNFMMELDLFGYGRVAGANSAAAKIELFYEGGSWSMNINNEFAIESLSDIKFHNAYIRSLLGVGVMSSKDFSSGSEMEHTNSIGNASTAVGKTITRVKITGVNSSNALIAGVLKFSKVKNRG